MRILRLDLLAFGPFAGTALDFGAEGAALHVIHGRNEAGKSTALRALSGLLFGIPETSPDAHLHPATALRVGALLEGEDGARLEVVRRRGRKNTLRGPDDAPIDPSLLDALLGGVDEDAFRTRFGLDHERLRAGAAALVEGEGRVGRSLFEAGLGGRGIARLVEALDDERRALYAPRGSKPALNAAFASLKKAQARIRADGLAIDAWNAAEAERAHREDERAKLGDELREARAAQRRLERLARVVPLASEHAALAARRRALGDAPLVPPEAIARRRTLSAAHEERSRFAASQSAEREALAAQRAAIVFDAGVLALGDDGVDALADRLASYRRWVAERSGRAEELAAAETRLAAALRALGRSSVDEVERMRPDPAAVARLRALGAVRSGHEQGLLAARDALARADARVEGAAARLAALGEPADGSDLERALEDAKREGDLDARREEAASTAEARRRELDAALRALAPFRGTAADLTRVARPLDETVELLAAEDEELRSDRKRLDEEARAIERERADADRERDRLLAPGAPPNEADLAAARTRRDEAFAAMRASGDARGPEADSLAAAIAGADNVADRLRADAARVASLGELDHRCRELDRRRADVEERERALAVRSAALAARLGEVRAALGVELASPAERRGDLRRFAAARALAERLDEAEDVERALERTAARHRGELARLLGDDASERRVLLDLAERLVRERRASATQRHELLEQYARARSERAEAEASVRAAGDELARFVTEWRSAVAILGLGDGATPEEAFALLDLLAEVEVDVARVAELRREVEARDRDAAELDRSSRALAERHAPDLAGEDAEVRVAELVRRQRAAKAASARAAALDDQIARLDTELAKLRAQLEHDDRELAGFLEAAHAPDVASLAAEEERSDAARALDARVASLVSSLVREAEGTTVEALIAEAAATDAARLHDERAQVDGHIDTLEARITDAEKRVGAALAALELARGRSAEDAAAEVEWRLEEIRAASARYARATLAAALLRREIERYRRSHEGPILARARALLPRLTLGRYVDLRVLGAGEPGSLRVVRSDGAELEVAALSDGTRDQLFLALRLAAIAVHAREEPPLPLVLDDVFIHFDDDRARAGLEVLGELSATTQVLFFTHHARLVELAREAVPAPRLRVHAIDAARRAESGIAGDVARLGALEGEVGDGR